MDLLEEISNNDDCDFYDSELENMSSESEVDLNELVDSKAQHQWSDSEENEEILRQEYKLKNESVWNEKTKKELPSYKKLKTHIKHAKKIFKTNNIIKLAKSFCDGEKSIAVCVTTLNDIYIIRDLNKKTLAFKIVNLMFMITNIEFLDENRLILANMKCKIIKILDINTLDHIDVRPACLNYAKKVIVSEKLYIMDETLKVYYTDTFEIEKILCDHIVDFCVSGHQIVTLKKDKTLAIYDKNTYAVLALKKYVDNVFYEKVDFTNKYYYVLMTKGIRIFDKDWKHIKDAFNKQFNMLVASEDFIGIVGDSENCLRMLYRPNNRPVKNIPSSSLAFPSIKSAFFIENELFYAHGTFISKLSIVTE